jgi:DNA-binding XRE family transcriptional regulator
MALDLDAAAVALRNLRRDRGLAVDIAARRIGVDRKTLMRAETGAGTPQPRIQKTIADYYGVPVTAIWAETVDDPTTPVAA